jgi:tRNA (mo5U34)-methyltransferase
VDSQQLQEQIAAFPRWQYRFEFDGGVKTPVLYEGQANRSEQRRRYFFDPLLELTGGTLAGRRVLDLGCNAGYWSLLASEAGADYVLGIDGRQEVIDQAELVFEAKHVDRSRYGFETANVFEQHPAGTFDVVLCLGLMDVTAKPVELFELMSATGAELIVIDTGINRRNSSFFEVASVNEPSNVVDHKLTLVPSREAVVELAGEFGYQAVALAHEMGDYAGLDDYREQRRLAFICSKDTSLGGLNSAPLPGPLPWWANAEQIREQLRRLRP